MYDNGLLKIANQVESSINEIVRVSADAVSERAKSLCSDEEIRDSISIHCEGNNAEVIADGAVPIEFGTAHTPPKPFLVPSIITEKNNIVMAMADAIENTGGVKND